MRHALRHRGGLGGGEGGVEGSLARPHLLPDLVEVKVVHGYVHHEVFTAEAELLPWRSEGKKVEREGQGKKGGGGGEDRRRRRGTDRNTF